MNMITKGYMMAILLPKTKQELLERYPKCQVKGCINPATDLHHCVFKRNRRFKDWIDGMWWNFQPTCADCNRNTHRADRLKNRMRWLRHQWQYYRDDILQDLANAPNKIRLFSDEYTQTCYEISQLILEELRAQEG
jgi:hypothetical protein